MATALWRQEASAASLASPGSRPEKKELLVWSPAPKPWESPGLSQCGLHASPASYRHRTRGWLEPPGNQSCWGHLRGHRERVTFTWKSGPVAKERWEGCPEAKHGPSQDPSSECRPLGLWLASGAAGCPVHPRSSIYKGWHHVVTLLKACSAQCLCIYQPVPCSPWMVILGCVMGLWAETNIPLQKSLISVVDEKRAP